MDHAEPAADRAGQREELGLLLQTFQLGIGVFQVDPGPLQFHARHQRAGPAGGGRDRQRFQALHLDLRLADGKLGLLLLLHDDPGIELDDDRAGLDLLPLGQGLAVRIAQDRQDPALHRVR